jgi:hypothetical protein
LSRCSDLHPPLGGSGVIKKDFEGIVPSFHHDSVRHDLGQFIVPDHVSDLYRLGLPFPFMHHSPRVGNGSSLIITLDPHPIKGNLRTRDWFGHSRTGHGGELLPLGVEDIFLSDDREILPGHWFLGDQDRGRKIRFSLDLLCRLLLGGLPIGGKPDFIIFKPQEENED